MFSRRSSSSFCWFVLRVGNARSRRSLTSCTRSSPLSRPFKFVQTWWKSRTGSNGCHSTFVQRIENQFGLLLQPTSTPSRSPGTVSNAIVQSEKLAFLCFRECVQALWVFFVE